MLYSQAIIEELIKGGLEKFLLVLHLDVKYFSLVDIGETNHVLGEIDLCETCVALDYLRNDEEIL